jgi:nitroreductase
MTDNKTFEQVVKSRRSVRSFSDKSPDINDIKDIAESALFAPYVGAAGIPFDEIRRIFILKKGTEKMNMAKRRLISQVKKNSRRMKTIMFLLPFMRKKMNTFAARLEMISKKGMPSLDEAAYYIIVAEKKGFPPAEKQSIAHAMENMWLFATRRGLGFQLLSATGAMSKNSSFLELLGLPKGKFEIDGCLIGIPKNNSESEKVIDLEKNITWMN